MSRFSKSVVTVAAVLPLLFSQCATIVSASRYPVQIKSWPAEADITITNANDEVVYTGVTPARVNLRAGNGFFKRGQYVVKFNLEGYEPVRQRIEFKLNGWYFGNIVFGGLIGLLIVDPATGAMWTLPRDQREMMVTLQEQTGSGETGLRILNLNDVPKDLRASLVRVR